jgi:hypothetical protein
MQEQMWKWEEPDKCENKCGSGKNLINAETSVEMGAN